MTAASARRPAEPTPSPGVLPERHTLDRFLQQERQRIEAFYAPYRRLLQQAWPLPDRGSPAPIIRPDWPIAAPRRRGGPQRQSAGAWWRHRGGQLAAHCTAAGHHPFDCGWDCLGAEADRNAKYLRDTASARGVLLWAVRAEAWRLLGCPRPHFGVFG